MLDKEFRINMVKHQANEEIKRINEDKNIFGRIKSKLSDCSLFNVCEFAGTEEDGGRCHRCSYNRILNTK